MYHGGKGHLINVHHSFIDTRFNEYRHVNLGTSDITQDIGTVFVNIFPIFSVLSLSNPYLMEALKFQFQIPEDPLDYKPYR